MDSRRIKQIVKQLEKSIEKWDFNMAFNASNDETQTRDFLIHPFFEDILGYSRIIDFSHEIVADVGTKRGRKVDIAITLGQKNPIIAVECKKASQKLTDNHFRQLNEYCRNLTSVKVGILTNGVIYQFYTQNKKENNNLHQEPFFTLDLNDYSRGDLETLALFSRSTIEINSILEEADDFYFMTQFDEALFKLLSQPSKTVLKELNSLMGGKRSTDKILGQINDLLNTSSVKVALERMIYEESKGSNSGIITTEEEIKAYNVVKTIVALSSKIKNKELERISYRDMKGSFAIIVDGNQRKKICSLMLGEKSKAVEIAGQKFELEDASIASLTGVKRELIDSAIHVLSE